MTIDAPTGVTIVDAETTPREQSSYVDWPAIIAGIVLASAISIVLIAFGSAVGLSFVDFGYNPSANASPIFVGIAAASWFLWVQVSSFMAGGYLTGRLRRRYFDANEDESDLRDGAHGLLVWAGGAVIGAIMAVSGLGAAAGMVGGAAATVTEAASNVAEDAVDPNAYFIDTLFRSAQPVDAATARDEAGRIFAQAALGDGTVSEEDRTYLATVVAANTGLTPDEATARVDQVITNVEEARQTALEAARIAQNTAIIGAFLLAASMLIAAVGAYWAAQKGGNHRDNNTVFADVFRRF